MRSAQPLPTTVLAALCRALLLTLSLAGQPHAAAAAPPVPIKAFFDHATMAGPKLSPDGKWLAMRVSGNSGHDRLGVVNLLDNSMQVVAEFRDADVNRFEWVNNTRLIYDSRDKHTAPGEQRYAPGLFAVNVDGSGRRQLANVTGRQLVTGSTIRRERLPANTYMLGMPGAQDSDWVYVVTAHPGLDGRLETAELVHLNTLTGKTESVDRPGDTRQWWLDAKGRPVLATTLEKSDVVLHYRDPKDQRWRKLTSGRAFVGSVGSFSPLGFAPDGTLYVTSRQTRDKSALYAFDLDQDKLADKPLIDMQEYDFSGQLITDANRLLGVRYLADAQGVAWFDQELKQVQEAVDQALPNRVNALSVARRSETPYVLVDSYSDRQPHTYWLFNRTSGQLKKIGDSMPAIDPARMATLDLARVKARDGLPIPTWVTVPDSARGKPAPMVVLVHGGPYVRGAAWEWDADAQFLASRGYVVLQPEFRGSRGYGARHFQAGWKQWGLAMQDDIADATRWAIEQGIADPERICIAGASYGGYATLMGLIRDPHLYKCGINWIGVTDIELLYTGHWSRSDDMSDVFRNHGMPALVGDAVKDAAQFAATSPLKQAARVTQPLLLAYGGVDRRVPLYHGRKFYDAVKETNKNVEWVVYDQEGHGWSLLSTRVDFWGRVETFLHKHIGTAAD